MSHSYASRWSHSVSLAFLLIALLSPILTVRTVRGATPILVNSINDTGSGTLRQAILDANAAAGADTITFSILGTSPHTITLSSSLPPITDDLAIDGGTQPGYGGTPVIVINGGGQQIFSITSHTVTINALLIQNGHISGLGGCINDASSATVTLSNSTVTGCSADYGGGIFVQSGTMNLNSSSVTNNTAFNANGVGGGIYVYTATAHLTNTVISGNVALGASGVNPGIPGLGPGGDGGGIHVYGLGTVTLDNSIVSNNTVTNANNLGGAGIGNFGTLSVSNSTFTGNGVPQSSPGNFAFQGGGILANAGTLTITNSTFTGNVAEGGGGIADIGAGLMTVTGSTFTGEYASVGTDLWATTATGMTVANSTFSGDLGGGAGAHVAVGSSSTLSLTNDTLTGSSSVDIAISGSGNTVTVRNSLLTDGCTGTITDGHYNLDTGSSCGFIDPSDLQNINPLLLPLQDNGGATTPHTFTNALMPGSPAIDRIPATGGCGAGIPTDQRGTGRPQPASGLCDIGAYEYVPVTPTIGALTVNHGPIAGGTSVTVSGTGFQRDSIVTFDGTSGAVTAVALDGTSLTVTAPAHTPPGLVDLVVINPGPLTATRTGAYRYDGPPLVNVSPASGSITGDARETITGAFFVDGASVTFGGLAATHVTVVNGTTITATTPAHLAGNVDVVVTLPGDTTETLASGYTYGVVTALPGQQSSGGTSGPTNPLPAPRVPGTASGSPSPLPTPR
ncbi:MAG: IPT/TIG domain-containing protein [Thermomicrobiales bacterium]